MSYTAPVTPDGGRDRSLGSGADDRAATDAFGDACWFPHQLDFDRDRAIFTRTNREALSVQAMLDARWDRSRAAGLGLPIEALADPPEPERSPGFIWHTAFCCSTLIADCLDWPTVSLALKEPLALVDLASARRTGRAPSDDRIARGLTRLLGRAFHPGERVLIKPSNDVNTMIDSLADGSGPILLLHSSLRRFLLSTARGGDERSRFTRALLMKRAALPGARFGAADVALLSDLRVAAVLWCVQMEEFRIVAHRLGPQRTRFLDCDVFLRDPEATLAQLDAFFELGLGPDRVAEVVRGPKLKRHAKTPSLRFDVARERDEQAKLRSVRGGEIDAAEAWCVAEFGEP